MSSGFWDTDFFAPPTPHVAPPSPKARAPKLVPEVDRLFQVQRDALRVLHALDDGDKHAAHEARQAAEDTYRAIRSYLADYGQ